MGIYASLDNWHTCYMYLSFSYNIKKESLMSVVVVSCIVSLSLWKSLDLCMLMGV